MVQVVVHVYATPAQVEALTQRLACLFAVGASPVVTALKCFPAPAAVTAELVRQIFPNPDYSPGRAGCAIEMLLGTCSQAQLNAMIDQLCTDLTEDRVGHTEPIFEELPWLVQIKW
ncbi:hypothetical protein [Rhodococcus sp. A5(2022)]|uniref:hypothetical protein n=1 Tax=Rhodococcus sp. A5(2022) TaxID=3003588 RepID=UPI0022A838B7|nr:hypothetical protein [Rhodococcus sp. A5(2022)]MCZ1073307.1 hypothetical protein [Rhodococcus sp. A5(2022)]